MPVSSGTASELIEELYLMGRAFRGAVVSTDEGPTLPGGLGVLMALEARGQCRQNELASDLCISQSALSRHVAELVAGIPRSPSGPRRRAGHAVADDECRS